MKRFRAAILLLASGCAYEQGGSSYDMRETRSSSFLRPESPGAPAPVVVPAPSSAPRLRAGETDDNAKFADYLRYFKAYPERNVRKIDITDRTIVTFVDRDGRPVSNAAVRISCGGERVYRGTTTAGGQLMFPPRAVGVDEDVRRFTAEIDGRRATFERGDEVEVTIDVPQAERDEIDVDVAFCLDTTGSMGDEIDAIKRTLRDVASRLDGLHPRPRLRYGLLIYRDHGDEYVTRATDFTKDLGAFLRVLDRVRADGGGDYEEAVSEALCRAVDDLSWRPGDAIRVLFLVGDAPPHTDYQDGFDYSHAMRRALEKGIKIFTLAASGLNDKGEFIWRQLAQFTLGKFIYISYSGASPHHVGEYKENNLDDLMVRAVKGEVESLRAVRPSPRPREGGRGREPDDFREYRGQRD